MLKPFGLHAEIAPGRFDFTEPDRTLQGTSLRPAWQVISEAGDDTLGHVYAVWAKPPFGIKAGVMPVLALAFMLSMRDTIAVYINGVFQIAIDDVVVDKQIGRASCRERVCKYV